MELRNLSTINTTSILIFIRIRNLNKIIISWNSLRIRPIRSVKCVITLSWNWLKYISNCESCVCRNQLRSFEGDFTYFIFKQRRIYASLCFRNNLIILFEHFILDFISICVVLFVASESCYQERLSWFKVNSIPGAGYVPIRSWYISKSLEYFRRSWI